VILQLPHRSFDLAEPVVMGVLNVTPDSFSDGGRYRDAGAALRQAVAMVGEGAAIIDVGGESTRPGAGPVGEQEELDRVVPVIERIRHELDCVVSVDTMKPAVMRAAAAAGAEIVNDVFALRAPGALEAVRDTGVAAVLMHMQGEPRTMQQQPNYDDVVTEVGQFLGDRIAACEAIGIGRSRLLIDPGIGFGKTFAHNLDLLAGLDTLAGFGLPLLVGVSRKSLLGQLSKLPVDGRLHAGLAAASIAVWLGASVIRTHDVRPTVEAIRYAGALRRTAVESKAVAAVDPVRRKPDAAPLGNGSRGKGTV
jgi:dihydropteroate synthase